MKNTVEAMKSKRYGAAQNLIFHVITECGCKMKRLPSKLQKPNRIKIGNPPWGTPV